MGRELGLALAPVDRSDVEKRLCALRIARERLLELDHGKQARARRVMLARPSRLPEP